ncbi:hypothetical protein PAPHI01_2162 [Pancytospora philotis]|nr:hypothetical protein PAPHI01_2162 [Pancytospora philotis]
MEGSPGAEIKPDDVGACIAVHEALASLRPFGCFRNFYMVRVLRNLKPAYDFTPAQIWRFLDAMYDMPSYHKQAEQQLPAANCTFDVIFDE